jgi:hypothetical protein
LAVADAPARVSPRLAADLRPVLAAEVEPQSQRVARPEQHLEPALLRLSPAPAVRSALPALAPEPAMARLLSARASAWWLMPSV